jgi:hypothetical protein
MTAGASETLRLIHGRVRNLMRNMRPEGGVPTPVNYQAFQELLGEVTRAASWLRQVPLPPVRDPEWEREISGYRNSLDQLQQMLPAIQTALLVEKARLEAIRNHLASVTAWANGSRGTL